jgi:hypothetical protein
VEFYSVSSDGPVWVLPVLHPYIEIYIIAKELDRIKSSASIATNSANREKELELKLRTTNAEYRSWSPQLRTAELRVKDIIEDMDPHQPTPKMTKEEKKEMLRSWDEVEKEEIVEKLME